MNEKLALVLFWGGIVLSGLALLGLQEYTFGSIIRSILPGGLLATWASFSLRDKDSENEQSKNREGVELPKDYDPVEARDGCGNCSMQNICWDVTSQEFKDNVEYHCSMYERDDQFQGDAS